MTCCPTGGASPPGQPPIRPTGSACTKRPASSSPARPAGPTLAEVLGRRGIHLLVYTVRMGSAVAEAQIDDLSDAEVHVLRGAAAHAGNVGILRQAGNTYVWDYKGISVTYVLVDPLARGRGDPGRPCPPLKAPALVLQPDFVTWRCSVAVGHWWRWPMKAP
jgi:hypothetical protein